MDAVFRWAHAFVICLLICKKKKIIISVQIGEKPIVKVYSITNCASSYAEIFNDGHTTLLNKSVNIEFKLRK